MSEGAIPMKKAIPIIVVTWFLSLATTLAVVYVSPNIFPPITTENIADSAVITTKLADGSVTSAKILDGTITVVDIADGSISSVKVTDGAVTTSKIADGAITSGKIASDAVVTIKLADGAVTSAKILDGAVTASDLASGAVTEIKIADGAITNIKLAPHAIPFAYSFSSVVETTIFTTGSWEDIYSMSVTLTVNRTSYLLIMFSTEARNADPSQMIMVQALVNDSIAIPGSVYMTPIMGLSGTHRHTLGYSTYAFNFIKPSVSAGTYNVKIQWFIWGGLGYARSRTLTVIALPE